MLESSHWGVCLCCITVGDVCDDGGICSAVSLRTQAGNSSGPVAIFL